LILMDIFLDDSIDGVDAVKEIHKNKRIPVIYITATNDAAMLKKAEETNYSHLVVKPFNYDNLKSLIESVFAGS
jgi:response regulator of citrate/malate metabolism